MKFALLVAILIALAALASANWSFVVPVPTTSLSPGQLFNFQFETDAAVEAGSTFKFTAPFLWNAAVAGSSGLISCTAQEKFIGYAVESANDWQVTLTGPLAAQDIITCPFRTMYDQKDDAIITVDSIPNSLSIIMELVPVIKVVAATKQDDWSVKVTIEFTNLAPNSALGPISLGYKLDSTDHPLPLEKGSRALSNLGAVDSKITLAADIYLHWLDGKFFLVTGESPANTATWETVYDVIDESQRYFILGKPYAAYATIATIQNKQDVPVRSELNVGTLDSADRGRAVIGRSASSRISYNQRVYRASSSRVKFSFEIPGYGADVVFGPGAKLTVAVAGKNPVAVPFTAKLFEYEFDAQEGELISVLGEFDVTDEWTDLLTFTGTLDGLKLSAEDRVSASINTDSISIGDLGLLTREITATFRIEVLGNDGKKFLSPVKFHLWASQAIATQDVGDPRAIDFYAPTCTSEDETLKFLFSEPKNGGLDLNSKGMRITGRLSNGAATAIVKCTHRFHPGDRSSARLSWFGKVRDVFTEPATKTYPHSLLVNSANVISTSADLDTLLEAVVKVLKDAFPTPADQFQGLVIDDFRYQLGVSQDYGAYNAGLALDLAGPFQYPSKKGAQLTLAFSPSGADGTFVPKSGLWYNESLKVVLKAANTEALIASMVFLNGNDAAVYEDSQAVTHGAGVPCATSAQCFTQACNNNLCVDYFELTLAQQAVYGTRRPDGGDDDDDSAAGQSVLTFTLALTLALIALIA